MAPKSKSGCPNISVSDFGFRNFSEMAKLCRNAEIDYPIKIRFIEVSKVKERNKKKQKETKKKHPPKSRRNGVV
jgi:hypothetical protein